jgi:hypothetical protein
MFYGVIQEASVEEKQFQYIAKILNSDYLDQIKKIVKEEVRKFSKLNRNSYNLNQYDFMFDSHNKTCTYNAVSFGSYVDEINRSNTKERIKALNEFVKDVSLFKKALSKQLSSLKFTVQVIEADYGSSLEEFKYYIKEEIKEGFINEASMIVQVSPNASLLKSITPSEEQLSSAEKTKYEKLYSEFAKFIKQPHKLSGNFWSGTIADICRLLGISSEKLNSVVSKNIKAISAAKPLSNGFSDTNWGEDIVKKLGNCYVLENINSASGDYLVYSISNEKLYYICYEHSECEVFFNKFPYNSKELEDVVYEEFADEEERSAVIELFKRIDQEKGFNLLTTIFK